ncbi:hypothetical protein DFH09DRAFT_1070376 [Mycena vulgaris]|nr:hypothetical protein DFH09DRAFT_1070376 [Mycena vulgaris]
MTGFGVLEAGKRRKDGFPTPSSEMSTLAERESPKGNVHPYTYDRDPGAFGGRRCVTDHVRIRYGTGYGHLPGDKSAGPRSRLGLRPVRPVVRNGYLRVSTGTPVPYPSRRGHLSRPLRPGPGRTRVTAPSNWRDVNQLCRDRLRRYAQQQPLNLKVIGGGKNIAHKPIKIREFLRRLYHHWSGWRRRLKNNARITERYPKNWGNIKYLLTNEDEVGSRQAREVDQGEDDVENGNNLNGLEPRKEPDNGGHSSNKGKDKQGEIGKGPCHPVRPHEVLTRGKKDTTF